ncbi:MAG: tryptophan--tRNA ligase [bacterium]
MNNFELLKNKIEKNNISASIIEINAPTLSVDDHVKTLGIKYREGMSTLLYREGDNFFALLRRDDTNIDMKALKAIIGTKNFRFCNEEDLKELNFEPGLASPLILNDTQDKFKIRILIDSAVTKMDKIICGSAHPNYGLEITYNNLVLNIGEYEVVDVTIPNPNRQDEIIILDSNIEIPLAERKRILTGDRPTGKLHIGHLIGSLQNRVKLQDEYEQFILMANIHALSDNRDNPKKVRDSLEELMCDYYAVGIDFDKTTVYIQSEVPETHEIFMYLANFASVQQINHNPTIKQEIKDNHFEKSTPLGFFIYPVHQAADILTVNADLVPVGKDQAPMVEDCREIARRFNDAYNRRILKEAQSLFGLDKNVPGFDGNQKMGKSLGNAIYLSDSEEDLRKKIFMIKTDPNRIHATDPGNVEGNTVFIYHDIYNSNKEEVEDLKTRYREGRVGDVEVKEKLFLAMNNLLTPIRERRREVEGKKAELIDIALESSKRVRVIARDIADKMKEAMMIKFD